MMANLRGSVETPTIGSFGSVDSTVAVMARAFPPLVPLAEPTPVAASPSGGGVPGGGVPVRYQRFSTTFGGIFGEGRCAFGLSDDFLFLSMKVMTLIVRKNDSAHQDPSGLRIK